MRLIVSIVISIAGAVSFLFANVLDYRADDPDAAVKVMFWGGLAAMLFGGLQALRETLRTEPEGPGRI